MILFLAIMSTLGWIAGVWLPWWAILGMLVAMAAGGCSAAIDGGLEPLVIGAGSFSLFMIAAGFASGNATVTDISSFMRVLFTGS